MEKTNKSKHTICVHAGDYIDPSTKGVNTPIFTSTSYAYLDMDVHQYPRSHNTINEIAVIKKLSALEGADDGLIFSSGMAAISTVLFALLKKGGHAVFQCGLYGGTHRFITNELEKFGIDYTFTESQDIYDFEKAVMPNTKVIYIETPSNPLLSITDMEAVANLAKSRNLISIIDNTFATPVNQNPVNFGFDIVIHSGTKYLGGHSDLCCGAAVSTKDIISEIRETAINFGGSPTPELCYLLERSMKTLAVRVAKHNENAMKIAEYLAGNSKIKRVYYPGLGSHPFHEIARKQMSGYGGMLSFEIDSAYTESKKFLKKLKVILPAMSLGGVESTITSPAETSHNDVSREERQKFGITDELLRLSVGIEEAGDLIEDIEQALEK